MRAADVPPASPVAAPSPATSAPAPVPSFYSGETVIRLGGSAIVPFRVAQPAAARAVLDAKVEPAGMAEIVSPPTVLEGRGTGFVRLRPLKAGAATLRIGDAALTLRIAEDEIPAPRPEVVTPVAGADVWGKIEVGVELFSPTAANDDRPVTLRLPDGSEIAPISTPGPREGFHRRFSFAVDADALPPGINFLIPVLHPKGAPAVEGEPVTLHVLRPQAGQLLSGNCADRVGDPRAAVAGPMPPPVKQDPSAPGGAYVANENAQPGWGFEVEVPEAGWYQLVMTARGDYGGGALPTIGVKLNEEALPLASARLADTAWHRVPVGTPFRLPPGDQILSVLFLNDFKYTKDRRTLALARYELLRLDGRGGEAGEGSSSTMMAGESGGGAMMAAPEMAGGASTMMMEGASMAAGAPMASTGADDVDMTEIGAPGTPLRVALDRVVDGKTVDGVAVLRGRCWWQHADAAGPGRNAQPRVELRVNGVARDVQYGSDLVFRISPGSLFPGPNTISLHAALPNGLTADAPPQRLFLGGATGGGTPAAGPARHQRRFTAVDPGWDRAAAARLLQPVKGDPAQAISIAPGTPSLLTLPADLEGDYGVVLEGAAREGAPGLHAAVRAGGADTAVVPPAAPAPAPAFASREKTDVYLGRVHLPRGAKQLAVSLVPGPNEKKGAPSSGLLRAVRLEEIVAEPSPPVPQLALLYPVEGAVLEQADAAVVRPFAENGFAWIDLSLDGQPLGMHLRPKGGLGPVVFPFATRGLAPGPHRLRAIAQSNDGRPGQSQEIGFTVPERPLSQPGAYSRAILLLDRFAYGAEPDSLAAILTEGEEVWLRRSLEERGDSPALTALDRETSVVFPQEQGEGPPVRALHQLLFTDNPARARFVMWTENHFSTWVSKTLNGPKWREHLRFWALGAAPFGDLLQTSATSPAMLVYLDQFHSYASRLNENYAREIMELHTLGVHGGYTQADVTTLAGVLNGWTLSDEADLAGPPSFEPYRVFRFDPLLNDGKAREVFGLEFPAAAPEARLDRVEMALEMLASHPSTAQFVSRKLAEHYLGDPPPPALVDRLAGVYLSSGGDMRAVLVALSRSPEFWASRAAPRLASPLDFSLRLSRLAGFDRPARLVEFLKQSGAGLFDRPTPDGYPELDGEYANSNSLLQRWRFAKELEPQLLALLPDGWTQPEFLADAGHRQQLIDFAAQRVTGRLLSPASEEAAEQVVAKSQAVGPDKAALLLSFLCQLPEANLR